MIISSIAAFLSTMILICTVTALAVAFPFFARASENSSRRKLSRASEPTLIAVEPALQVNQAMERLAQLEKARSDLQFSQAVTFLRSLSEAKPSQKVVVVPVVHSDLQAGPALDASTS